MKARSKNKENNQALNEAVVNDSITRDVHIGSIFESTASSFERDMKAIASDLFCNYQNGKFNPNKFWAEEIDLAKKGLYVIGFSHLFTAYYLHLKGKLLGLSCTNGGHVVGFTCIKSAHKKAKKMLQSFNDMDINDLFAMLHTEIPSSFLPVSR